MIIDLLFYFVARVAVMVVGFVGEYSLGFDFVERTYDWVALGADLGDRIGPWLFMLPWPAITFLILVGVPLLLAVRIAGVVLAIVRWLWGWVVGS